MQDGNCILTKFNNHKKAEININVNTNLKVELLGNVGNNNIRKNLTFTYHITKIESLDANEQPIIYFEPIFAQSMKAGQQMALPIPEGKDKRKYIFELCKLFETNRIDFTLSVYYVKKTQQMSVEQSSINSSKPGLNALNAFLGSNDTKHEFTQKTYVDGLEDFFLEQHDNCNPKRPNDTLIFEFRFNGGLELKIPAQIIQLKHGSQCGSKDAMNYEILPDNESENYGYKIIDYPTELNVLNNWLISNNTRVWIKEPSQKGGKSEKKTGKYSKKTYKKKKLKIINK